MTRHQRLDAAPHRQACHKTSSMKLQEKAVMRMREGENLKRHHFEHLWTTSRFIFITVIFFSIYLVVYYANSMFFLFFFYSRAAVSVVFSTLLSCSGNQVLSCTLFASCIFIWTNKDNDNDDDVHSFRRNTRTWRTPRGTDTARRHRPLLRIASRGKNLVTPAVLCGNNKLVDQSALRG